MSQAAASNINKIVLCQKGQWTAKPKDKHDNHVA